jgi:hypothetical protein
MDQLDLGGTVALHSSGENQPTCKQNHQWNATQYNVLRVVLEPVAISDGQLADVFYSGVEVI